jgi:hypothetical protein
MLTLALAMVLLPVVIAQADTVTDMGLTTSRQIVVDSVHQHLFMAMEAANAVQVRSYSGALITTVPGQTGAVDFAVNPEASRVFVALSDGHVTAIDTTTLAEVDRWATPTGLCLREIAWAGVSLVVSYGGCEGTPDSWVASLDTADPSAVTSAPFAHRTTWGTTSIEGGGNVLVSYTDSPEPVVTFDASTLPPTVLASAVAGACTDAAVTADGSEVTLACRGPLETRRTSDLAVTSSYPASYADGWAMGVAEAAGVLAFEGSFGSEIPNLDVFRRGEAVAARTVTWKIPQQSVYAGQLAFTADASRLFAVTMANGRTFLHVVASPTLEPLRPLLSLTTDHSVYPYGREALVTAHLGATHDNRRVDIYATPYGGTRQLIRSGTANASGHVAVRYLVTRATTFSAVFTGDDRYVAGTVKHSIRARARLAETLYGVAGRSGKYALYRPKKDPVFGVVVAPAQRRSCVLYKLQRRVPGAWHKVVKSRCYGLRPDSSHAVRLGGPHVEGTRFRIKAILHASSYSVRTRGPWSYLKFQRR